MKAHLLSEQSRNHLNIWLVKIFTIRLLFLPFLGLLFFIAGESVNNTALSNTLLAISVLIGFLFYIITLGYLLAHFSVNTDRKIFWLVAIVCMPVIGNIIYVIFMQTANRRQKLHTERF